MEYKELAKIYHMDASADRDTSNLALAHARKTADSSFDLGFETRADDLFIAMPRELVVLYERVLRVERKVSTMMRSIPGIARLALERSLVLDEVVSTNAIEDIHSTRRQIKDALESRSADGVAFRRFKELAQLYLALSERGAESVPRTPEDIRGIYDKIMEGELPDSKLPDGKLFRKDGVEIISGVKAIHSGVEPEEKIVSCMESMLSLVSSDEVPAVIGAIASHYIFEYAHPFYDGNGRTGRYLLSLFLSEPLSSPTVLSLSRVINENRDLYYKAFRTAEDPLNHGELTFFVLTMLELIRIAQSDLIDGISTSKEEFDNAREKLRVVFRKRDVGEKDASVVFMLVQYELFGMFGDATIEEISDVLGVGKQMARKHIAAVENLGMVEKRRKRPASFALTDSFKNEIGLHIVVKP